MISKEKCCLAIRSLVAYGVKTGLVDALDEMYVTNTVLFHMNLEAMEPEEGELIPFPACLNLLCDYATENNLMEDTITNRDLFDTKIMGILTPNPSVVIKEFNRLRNEDSKKATDYFYKLSQDSNYIRRDRIQKDMHWTAESKYGELEVSINLSKPEKDPRDIAAAKLKKSSGYPMCQLCVENEGYEGTLTHPARENHRIMPIDICDEKWGFQYSPYVYYNEHCIVLNTKHVPMSINDQVFDKLFSFVAQFPHYFVGSNADLPIVGGSILTHEHFQGGCHVFPMEKAAKEFEFSVPGFESVNCAVLHYPMSVIRLNSANRADICKLACKILSAWRTYTDKEAFIFAETDGERHNTITPIARMNQGNFELDLVLRNNITTEEHPMGVYHPHAELHHIKKENIGLIEVMGLAILPGRLKNEMQSLKEAILSGKDLRTDDALLKHADWAEEFLTRHADLNEKNADAIIQAEIGAVFEKVLECAGVYKCTEEGRRFFKRFIETL